MSFYKEIFIWKPHGRPSRFTPALVERLCPKPLHAAFGYRTSVFAFDLAVIPLTSPIINITAGTS
jgi:hypothetical protein